MKKIILLIVTTIFLYGCGTTFDQRKEVYLAIYKKTESIVLTIGIPAAKIYLQSKINSGEINYDSAVDMLNNITEDSGSKDINVSIGLKPKK